MGWPSPSSNPAAESQVASLEEAAQKLQRHVAESLDNLVAVYQCKMAACEAQTIHGQQQQQKQQQELEEALPGSEALGVISIPGMCNAKGRDTFAMPSASLSEKRGRTGSIPRRPTDARIVNTHPLECLSLPGTYRSQH